MATVSELTSKNIASAQANVQTWGGILLNVKVYGAKGDGVTDCSAQVQEAVNYCLANGLRLYFPKGTYLIGTPVLINYDTVTTWTDFSIEGSHVKSAYSDLVRNEGTIIKTNGNDAFVFTPQYPCSSINIKRIHGFNSSGTDAGSLFKIDMGLMISSQLKTLWVEEVTAYNFGKTIHFLNSAGGSRRNLPYTYISKFYTYSCSSGIYCDTLCGTTIFKVANTLIHGSTLGGFVFEQGEYQFDNVWFEGCEPAGIVKLAGGNISLISMNDTYYEGTGDVSGSGAWEINDNTDMIITGRSNLPGALSMPAPVLPKFCNITNYTLADITLKVNGGIVMTPQNVSLDLTYKNLVFYPVNKAVLPERPARVFNSYSGGFEKGFGTPVAGIPPSLENQYTWSTNAYATDMRGSLGTDVVDRVLVSSFLYYVSSGLSMGLGVESTVTKDGINDNFNTGFVETSTDAQEGYVIVVTTPIAAGVDVTRYTLQARNQLSVSKAYTHFQTTTESGNIGKLGHPQMKKHVYTQDIATGTNYTFLEKYSSAEPYAIRATLVLDNGKEGMITYNLYGINSNTNKYRDVVSGASKNASIVVTAADGANLDMFNINVNNTTGATINAKLIVEY